MTLKGDNIKMTNGNGRPFGYRISPEARENSKLAARRRWQVSLEDELPPPVPRRELITVPSKCPRCNGLLARNYNTGECLCCGFEIYLIELHKKLYAVNTFVLQSYD